MFDQRLQTLFEELARAYISKVRYDRTDKKITDPAPHVLELGSYVNHKGNEIVGGINLNYLTRDQFYQLMDQLPNIFTGINLRERYRIGRHLAAPEIFKKYYRTWLSRHFNRVSRREIPIDTDVGPETPERRVEYPEVPEEPVIDIRRPEPEEVDISDIEIEPEEPKRLEDYDLTPEELEAIEELEDLSPEELEEFEKEEPRPTSRQRRRRPPPYE